MVVVHLRQHTSLLPKNLIGQRLAAIHLWHTRSLLLIRSSHLHRASSLQPHQPILLHLSLVTSYQPTRLLQMDLQLTPLNLRMSTGNLSHLGIRQLTPLNLRLEVEASHQLIRSSLQRPHTNLLVLHRIIRHRLRAVFKPQVLAAHRQLRKSERLLPML